MTFRTELNPESTDWKIDHHSRMLCLGSCFADEIGSRLQQGKFRALVNPFGIVFHPYPLIDLLNGFCRSEEEFLGDLLPTIFNREEQWGSFALPGVHPNRDALIKHIRFIHELVSGYLETADYLVLTFGTAIGFYHENLELTVANCHKFPEKDFNRFVDWSDGMYERVSQALSNLNQVNPKLKFIITVSPVRHIRSGLINNSTSKALLRVLCSELASHSENIEYFPSYEIMMDDLRDYRFYKPDMIHPSEVAVNYIWEKLASVYFSNETHDLMAKVEQVRKDLAHRPMQPQSPAHRKFLDRLESKIRNLPPHLDMEPELEALSRMKKANQPE